MSKLNTRFRKAEDSPGFLLWNASNLLQRLHAGCLKDLDVTPTQFSVMTCLVYLSAEGGVTASSIVSHTGIDKMTVSDIMKTLVAKRYARKSDNPADRRSFLIEPTALGTRVTNSAVERIEALDDEFFQSVKSVRAFKADLHALVTSDSSA